VDTTVLRTRTFSGVGGGETVTISVTDLAGGNTGCAITTTQSYVTNTNTSPPMSFSIRPFNYERDCSNLTTSCNSVNFFVNIINLNASRLAIVQQPGNATITIGGNTYNLTYLSGAARFRYDPIATGGPVLVHGTPISVTFFDGCTTITKSNTVVMRNDFLSVTSSTITNSATCSYSYRILVLGDQDLNGGSCCTDRGVFFCAQTSLTIERRIATSPDVWQVVPSGEISPDPVSLGVVLGVAIPSAASAFIVNQPGTYRVTATDACHTVQRILTINPVNPLNSISVSQNTSLLEGTAGIRINFNGLPALGNPVIVKISRVDGQTSMVINPTLPASLAGNYTINFPMVRNIPYPVSQYYFQDLPLGQYKVEISDGCSDSIGYSKIWQVNLTNAVAYNPSVTVTNGCIGSNSIAFNMNPVNSPNSNSTVRLHTINNNGGLGSFVQASNSSSLSGGFTNLNSGNYLLHFSNVKCDHSSGTNQYSLAMQNTGPWEYTLPISIAPYENFEIAVNTIFCNLDDLNTGIVDVKLIGGSILYPMHFSLFEASNTTQPIQGPIVLNSPDLSHLFTNLSIGNYVVLVNNNCYSLSQNVQLTASSITPTALTLDAIVCPNTPATVGVLTASTSLFDINWFDENDSLVATGTPVSLQPSVSTTYDAVYSITSSLGCTNTTTYSSQVTVNVSPNPIVTLAVSDIDLCNNSNFEILVDSSQIDFQYELVDGNKQSFNPPVLLNGTGLPLSFNPPANLVLTSGMVFYVFATNGNAGCSAYLVDSCLVFQSSPNAALTVVGDDVCSGEDAEIQILDSEIGVVYTVFQNNLALNPALSSLGNGGSLQFSIPSNLLSNGLNTFNVQISQSGCATVFLSENAIIAVDTTNPTFTNCPANLEVFAPLDACSLIVNWIAPTAFDNCAIDTVFSTHNSGDSFQLGNTSVSYTVVDGVGNSATCTFVVQVIDTVPPVSLNCPVDIRVNTSSASCDAIVSWIPPVFIDNCGDTIPSTFITSPNAGLTNGGAFPIGISTITYSAMDASGNNSICSFEIIVVDSIVPSVTNCPSNLTAFSTDVNCAIEMNWTAPIFIDNCSDTLIPTITTNPTTGLTIGSAFPVGVTTVTYSASDSTGNVATCSFTVTVSDTIAPTVSNCPTTLMANSTDSTCNAIVSWVNPVFNDNCGGVLIPSIVTSPTAGLANGSAFPVGTTTVTYTASDASGNSASCSFTIVVVDSVAPVLTNCPSNIVTFADSTSCSKVVTWTEPVFTDNCQGVLTAALVSNPINGLSNGSVFPLDTTTVLYTATDSAGNSTTCAFQVIVVDNVAPVFMQCPVNISIANDTNVCGAIVSWQAPSVVDNCTNTVSFVATINSSLGIDSTTNLMNGSVFPIGITKIKYTVVDNAGLVDSCTFTITVVDTELPIILNGPQDMEVFASSTECIVSVSWTEPSASDNCFISALSQTGGLANGVDFPIGVHTVTYTALDVNGNSANHEFTITVVDTIVPVFVNCPNDIVATNDTNVCGAIIEWPIPMANDNCSVSISQTNGLSMGSVFPIGTTPITYVAVDSSGNESTCSFNVIVSDTQFPVITGLPTNTVIGCEEQLVEWMAPTASDNCDIASFTYESNPTGYQNGSVFPLGSTTVTYTATDVNGNLSKDSFIVVVNPLPSIELMSNSLDVCNADVVNLKVENSNPNFAYIWSFEGSDIAMGASHTIASIQPENEGVYEISVTDNFNCTTSAEIQVNVKLCDIVITEGMSPNGDGSNDAFYIENILAFPNTSVTIFNRWGAEVYYSPNYKNDWYGNSMNPLNIGGDELPEGTYFYIVVLGGDTQSPNYGRIYKGYFYIKK
jgi:gliding motility-associated-like protein